MVIATALLVVGATMMLVVLVAPFLYGQERNVREITQSLWRHSMYEHHWAVLLCMVI